MPRKSVREVYIILFSSLKIRFRLDFRVEKIMFLFRKLIEQVIFAMVLLRKLNPVI